MILYYDCISHSPFPCADNDALTPNNIVNMALLKGRCYSGNGPQLRGKPKGGMGGKSRPYGYSRNGGETSEGFTFLSFPSADAVEEVQRQVYRSLPDIKILRTSSEASFCLTNPTIWRQK